MEPARHNKYSAADMERYHNGSMSPAEMHALEKAALDDPFLADAMDGYVHAAAPAADLAFLKKKIQSRRTPVVPMNRSRRVLLSIAAMLLLFIGFGWLAYQFSNRNQNNVAYDKYTTPVSKHLPSVTDSIRKSEGEATTEDANAVVKTNKTVPDNTTVHVNEIAESNKSVRPQTFSKAHTAARASDKRINAHVVDAQNNAVPGAVVSQAQKVLTVTDASGNFSVPATDSNLDVRVNAAGYQQQRTTLLPTDSATKIVLQPGASPLKEVVVTPKQNVARKTNRVRLEAAQPLTGWKRFNAYVEEQVAALRNSDSTITSNEVVLSFDVDAEGIAKNINVEKSACAPCALTAVHLIQQGSKWKKTGSGNRARAWIHF